MNYILWFLCKYGAGSLFYIYITLSSSNFSVIQLPSTNKRIQCRCMPGIIFLPSVYAGYGFEMREREREREASVVYKPEFEMKCGGSGYNNCPIVTVFIYMFEENCPQEAGFSVCVCLCKRNAL